MTAQLGKAKYIPVSDLEAGMKVHRDVMGRRGQPLVSAGEILTKMHVDKLKKWESREQPQGAALPRKNPVDRTEPIRHAEFQGGWRPSHFNKNGVLVSSTLASGEDFPAVERDPTLSPVFQNRDVTARKTFTAGDTGIDSPIQRCWAMREQIKVLESTNDQLGGTVHKSDKQYVGEQELTERKLQLESENRLLIGRLSKENVQRPPARGRK